MKNLYIHNSLVKDLIKFNVHEKRKIRDILDLMESIGQIGEPLMRNLNIWRIKIDDIRILYELKSDKMTILSFKKDIENPYSVY